MDRMAANETKGERTNPIERRRFYVKGIVQGVGFRPMVYRLAIQDQLNGYVCNQLGEVIIDVEGSSHQLQSFIEHLIHSTQEPAKIDHIEETTLPLLGYTQFIIKESESTGQSTSVFPPDLAICSACLSDLTNSNSRYFAYPFTSCTYCGPRYSLIQTLPYDRAYTMMNPFPLCQACRSEYQDPLNRRFHAQTIACPECGPKVELVSNRFTPIPGNWRDQTKRLILDGSILAVKGIGGFHLVCDASNGSAVQRLRDRKRRPKKPLAILVQNIKWIESYFEITSVEREILQDRRATIVLLKPRSQLRDILPIDFLAPGYQRIGVMLPYSPLHFLLCSDQVPFLVATSGNQSGLPIARTNEEALSQLNEITDYFLLHDREIQIRVEDSVCQVVDHYPMVLRRSRGFVPEMVDVPIPPAETPHPTVLAIGAEMKNTFCLLHENQALLSQHMGEMDSAEQVACWKEGIQHIQNLLGKEPDIIAYDPHPNYLITQEAIRMFPHKTRIPIFHHHAHMVACMAENQLHTPVIGCILDGTGYGKDGTLCGFEILVGDYTQFERMSYLQPFALPGGEASIRHPWMTAVSLFYQLTEDADQTREWAAYFFPQYLDKLPFVLAQLDGRIPSPKVSSAGRWFDAVSAILGLCRENTYEGEAAILLGEMAEAGVEHSSHPITEFYPFLYEDNKWIMTPALTEIRKDIQKSLPIANIAQKFHHTVAEMICSGALDAKQRSGIQSVVLSGGVWNNRYLLSYTQKLLEKKGFKVYTHQNIPAGDGGLALGQAVSALWRWQQDVSIRTSKGTRN